MRPTLLAIVLVALLLAGCSGGGGDAESTALDPAAAGDGAAVGEAVEEMDEEAAAPEAAAPEAADGEDVAADSDDAAQGVGGEDGRSTLPEEAPPLVTGDRVIKEGTITIEVAEDGFDQAFRSVIATARQLGGDVVSSDTSTDDEGTSSGSVTVRVPVNRYEDLLVGVTDIGEVRSRALDATDVTTEFIDLESRLRHLEAQEAFYLGLMEDAESVDDAISVQQRLNTVQADIEQVRGRLRYLEDRTSFSTLTVELLEPGTPAPVEADPSARPALARYWETARDAFVNVLGIMLVVAVFSAPLLVLGGLAVLAWRMVARSRTDDDARRAADERVEEPKESSPA